MHTPHNSSDTPEKDCILCGRCLEVCPLVAATQREELSPKAKHYLAARLRAEPGALAALPAARLAGLCLSCGRCEKACPQNLCAPDLVSRLRAEHPDWRQWFWKTWIGQGARLWPMASGLSRVLPGEAAASMSRRLKSMRRPSDVKPFLVPRFAESAAPTGGREKVALFPGCLASHVRHDWTSAARRMLVGLGYEALAEPAWACCGCTLGHAGIKDAQVAAQRANVAAWREAGRPLVATFCATCHCGLRSYAGESLLFSGEEAEVWSKAVRPLAGFWGETAFDLAPAAPESIYYHRPCHGAGNGADMEWLRRVLGPRLVKCNTLHCCGMGGVMQLGAPELSARVAATLWEDLGARPGSLVLTSCSGCVLQLRATAPKGVAVAHWLDILDLKGRR